MIDHLAQRLMQRWVLKWYGAFLDRKSNGFYERLDPAFQPLETGQRRLLTQCRQLAMYSDVSLRGMVHGFNPDLAASFSFIVRTYNLEQLSGRFRFSVDDNGTPLDNTYDLYTLAFVIFAFSHYFRATNDPEAERLAGETIEFINKSFRIASLPGFLECLDENLKSTGKTRRHESHMHLLEACLFAANTWDDNIYKDMADEIIDLFTGYFYDEKNVTIGEYYNDELSSCPDGDQVIVEPGHYYEWIWLLKKHAVLCGDDEKHDYICKPLLEWANKHGRDHEYGGIYDELAPDGSIIRDTKRLWPFTEAIKANALMLDSKGVEKQPLKDYIAVMVSVFSSYYMQGRGFWVEWLNRDMSSTTDYMPGTTPYHVYFGIMETKDALHKRGKSKSVFSSVRILLYRSRRNISFIVRNIKKSAGVSS